MHEHSAIKGLLFDLDGVLYIGSRPIEGAIDTIRQIKAGSIPTRFITNTSTLSLASLQKKMQAMGYSIPTEDIISAPQATLLYLKQQQDPVCRLVLADDVKQDFKEIRQANTYVDYIVIGDIGGAWSYTLMNELFNHLMEGAKLIAIHKNRFWQTEHGLQMDIGGFVDALEYASGVKAMLMGKPSKDFFQIALTSIGIPANEAAIIGDDIDVDIGGGQQAGLKGILVKTGKYRDSYAQASSIKPDFVIESVMDLPGLIGTR
jgi:HAD superfamily hydrolase (TIGR01458 family)